MGFIPTSLLYNRRLKQQAEKIAASEREFKVQKRRMEEGKLKIIYLESELFWDDLYESEREHAKTICITQGFHEAVTFVKTTGRRRSEEIRRAKYMS